LLRRCLTSDTVAARQLCGRSGRNGAHFSAVVRTRGSVGGYPRLIHCSARPARPNGRNPAEVAVRFRNASGFPTQVARRCTHSGQGSRLVGTGCTDLAAAIGDEVTTALRVLLIEDCEDDATLVIRELSRAGYVIMSERVDTADALKAALESRGWDIAIADF